MSHTGGALPYQSGRMDKNTRAARLPRPASHYLKRMYTDTVSPHAAGMKFAIEYYGIDHVMYGTDYPCWDPATALALIDELELSQADREKLFYGNARRILGLRDPVRTERSPDRSGKIGNQSIRRMSPIGTSRRPRSGALRHRSFGANEPRLRLEHDVRASQGREVIAGRSLSCRTAP